MNIIEWIIKAIGETILYIVKLIAVPFAWLGYIWQNNYQEKMSELFKPTLLEKEQKGLIGIIDKIYFLLIRTGIFTIQLALIIPSIIVWLFIFKDPVPKMTHYFTNWIKR